MTLNKIISLTLFTSVSVSLACVTHSLSPQLIKPKDSVKKSETTSDLSKFFLKPKRQIAAALIPFSEGHIAPSLESKLGNLLLNNNRENMTLSIPAIIQKSSYHPFGDGQSNAKLSLGSFWKFNDFPAVGVQTKTNGKIQRTYIFSPNLKITNYKETQVDSTWIKVQPDGWKDSFYFRFDSETLPLLEFLNGIPEKLRTFSENRIAPDLAQIGKSITAKSFDNLGAGYNKEHWTSENVHGLFPDINGEKTALGSVLTWGIVDKQFGPFKNLYTCFESRQIDKEKKLGVPSGAGWHLIGDAAETIINDISNFALPVAVARSQAFPDSAYGLTENMTATWLQSDQVFVTQKDEFHFYLNPYETTVCTEIWVHNCVPSATNNWGFNCN